MEQLNCVVQTYAWGKRGRGSRVAELMEGGSDQFQVDSESTYAELWMGTHPTGPATIIRNGEQAEPLSVWLKAHPTAAGESAANGELPFLFKVLSVAKALSIQAHPDLELARSLHAKFPTVYKDANHKPEMAIALTRFEALCQFRPIEEIIASVENIPELRAVAGEDAAATLTNRRDRDGLRAFFNSFIHADTATIATQTDCIRARLRAALSSILTPIDALVLRLIDQYAADIGCFCPYLLNYITLEPGDAVFLGANEPHAYLSGDCVECMACSDNVVRAGLTPKFIDKDTLCEMLTYRTETPAVLQGARVHDGVRVYSPPVPEFQVEAIHVTPAGSPLTIPVRSGASILLITKGTGIAHHVAQQRTFAVRAGRTYLVGAHEVVRIEASEGIEAFRAFPNESVGTE